MSGETKGGPVSIWWWAFGYFAAYVPYSAMTKVITSPRHDEDPLSGIELLPGSTVASLVSALLFLWLTGWWRSAPSVRVGPLQIPYPTLWPALSGLCSAAIIATTTLSYTFAGASIVLMMLLMRGGVLVIAPMVDGISRRKVQPRSWVALGLTLIGVLIATATQVGFTIPLLAALDIAIYLGAYFGRLRLMSHAGKRISAEDNRRFFVEEQLASSPSLVAFLALFAALGQGSVADQLQRGYAALGSELALPILLIGLFSQGTGIFGALVLLDARENSFCVPVNRGSSILAGVVATTSLWLFFGGAPLSLRELFGAVMVLGAIAVLAMPRRTAAPR